MRIPLKTALLATALAGATAIGGCAEDRGHGYSGVSVGYNASWGDPYWGWYGDYYYPGTGVYVYDRNHHRSNWNDTQRGYWESRRNNWRGDHNWHENWNDYDGKGSGHHHGKPH